MKSLIFATTFLSFSAIAAEPELFMAPENNEDHPAYSVLEEVGEDVVYTTSGKEIQMSDYIEAADKIQPDLTKFCLQKTLNARLVIASVDKMTMEDTVDAILEHMVAPQYVRVDTERMIRDIYREDKGSEFDFSNPLDIKKLLKKEMKACLINKY